MGLLWDLLPVLIFFAAYKAGDIYVATLGAVATALIQAGYSWFRHRRLSALQIVGVGLLVVFGGATLLLRDPLFIQWKPTVLYWLLGGILLGGRWLGGGLLLKRLLGDRMVLPDPVWRRLEGDWILFFLFMGGVNLAALHWLDEAAWVNFKLFGLTGLTLLFTFGEGFRLAPHMSEAAGDAAPEDSGKPAAPG
ncbi:MAG: septation protein A [Magnetococcales bacterium]|nr:septation protein A [Magnetococcales bacterium]